jgi:hypothetical protein
MAKVVAPKEPEKKQEKPADNAPRVDEQIMGPGKYEITNKDTFRIELSLSQSNGRWTVSDKIEKDKDIEKHWVEFRMWTFDEDVELRKKSTLFDAVKRMHFIDHDQLNRLKIQRLLRAWSFDKDNPNLKLQHVNGVLTDESWEAFKKLHTNIVRYIIEKMNNVLEFNQ